MRKILAIGLLAGAAGLISGVAEARVDVGIGIGLPWPAVVAPPPPVYYEPAPVYVAPQPVVVAPGYYDDWQARAWREQQWRERRWREREWRERHRDWHRWHDDDD
ncbi:hypothetical protein P3W85_02320 [Cupriavidus basilensis]|uniref:Uncharacterized protein n=1 Tax=Cupriavidus basilensis TaxID=68895 RepID=A0ABT6AGS0_9BURK|nr:hypothetical protein [Cupriavidus basilensis]MDF3831799.1 hypothetical protein [Cupriavidus basilensis]